MKNLISKIMGSKSKEDPRNYLLDTMPKEGICAEIGAWKGDFSQRILKRTKPSKLYLVDPWQYVEDYENAWYGGSIGSQEGMDTIYNSVCKRFAGEIESGQLETVRMGSAEGIATFEDAYFDWVYIDGNHTYEYVKKDLEISWQKTKTGGFVTGDDYGVKGWWDDGVTVAVDEFVKNMGDQVEVVAIVGSQFILKKMG